MCFGPGRIKHRAWPGVGRALELGLGLLFWTYRVFTNPWFQLQKRKQSKCSRPFPGGNETLSASSWVKNQGVSTNLQVGL